MATDFSYTEIVDAGELDKLRKRSDEMLDEALALMNSSDDWKLSKEDPNGAVLYSKRLKKGSKRVVFKIQGKIPMSPGEFREKFFGPEAWNSMAQWNETVRDARVLQDLANGIYITYQMTQPNGPGGMVSSRDFVYLRKDKDIGDAKFVCYETISVAGASQVKGVVRADCGPCCVKIEATGEPDECLFTWTVDMDFKLAWFPESLFNEIFRFILFSNFKATRDRAVKLKAEAAAGDS